MYYVAINVLHVLNLKAFKVIRIVTRAINTIIIVYLLCMYLLN